MVPRQDEIANATKIGPMMIMIIPIRKISLLIHSHALDWSENDPRTGEAL